MKRLIMIGACIAGFLPAVSQKTDFSNYPVYDGDDLGMIYTENQTSFRVYAPTVKYLQLRIYDQGIGGKLVQSVRMNKSLNGTWTAVLKGDLKYHYYSFRAQFDTAGADHWSDEVPDPYVKAAGLNGKRGLIIDLKETDPPGWNKDKSPVFAANSTKTMGGQPTDAIIYELHVRDASIALNSGIKHKGKFLGLAETGTNNKEGLSTGLDHLIEMGVTHIHLLPIYDFVSIDESRPNHQQYNWGYDPLNYNTPEGSYSSDASDGIIKIKELKQLIKKFHDNKLRVVMDVVYNHTGLTGKSGFNQLVPGYYYRQTPDGKLSNASACGNETASERPMVRKFILESMKYWVKEYHIDGFRVDLMGIHDIETMNLISRELQAIKPDIIIYGEGWTAGASPLPDSLRALKKNAYKLDRIAVFSDDLRDGIKGHVFEHKEKGFVSGKPGLEESVKFGIVAAMQHPQINYSKVNYSTSPYAAQPWHMVSYAECHDNHVLWDKLSVSAPEFSAAERKEMHKLALSIVLTSQGIAFLHAGTEFLRTKKGVENSFESPDSINAIDWGLKTKNKDVTEYVKNLISIRREHPAFRMTTQKQVAENLRFIEKLPDGVIAYTINGEAAGDKWKMILVAFNGSNEIKEVPVPKGKWQTAISSRAGTKLVNQLTLQVQPHSAIIIFDR
jgi:pullulanase